MTYSDYRAFMGVKISSLVLRKTISISGIQARACLFIFLAWFSTLPVFAQVGVLQKKITLNAKEVSLGFVLKEIEKQTGYTFVYNSAVLKANKQVTAVYRNQPVGAILEDLLGSLAQGIQVHDKQIYIRAVPKGKASVSGRVTSLNGEAVIGASVVVSGTSTGSSVDTSGKFEISGLQADTYSIEVSSIGFGLQSKTINVKEGQNATLNFSLTEDKQQLQVAIIVGKSELTQLKQSGYNVNAIDVKRFANSTTDLNQVLNSTSGIRIREQGGLGSDFNFSINGLSGRQVKFFMDGIPMENFGAAMALNNIPVNLAERLEVYKGVVPIELGADALGGAVNVVTDQQTSKYLDAAYSFGSFNTHRASLSGRYTKLKSGFTVNANGFYNYSDNNYLMKNMEIEDGNGNFILKDFRRFNDKYWSAMGLLEAGYRNKKWADVLLVGINYSSLYRERQTGIDQEMVFGKVHSHGDFIMPSVKYKKDNLFVQGLNVSLSATYALNNVTSVDTSIFRYRWDGTVGSINRLFGEQGALTLYEYTNRFAIFRGNMVYKLGENNSLNLNYNLNSGTRKGINTYQTDQSGNALDIPNKLGKGILGIAWQSNLLNNRLESSVFGKHYRVHSYIREAVYYNGSGYKKEESDNTRHYLGYGVATRYKLSEMAGFKVSFEHAYRLPEVEELFGDGITVIANTKLKPEESDNINVGGYYSVTCGDHKVTFEASGFYRNAKDFINAMPGGTYSSYANIGKVRITGMDGEVKYTYSNLAYASVNASYMDATNIDKSSAVYKDRIPNQPWLYANGDIGIGKNNLRTEGDRLQLTWFTQYVHWFYLTWPSRGYEPSKSRIPTQFIHNVALSYSMQDGKYNVSLEAKNLFNELAFDNFRMQKPGQAFYVKLRYFLR